MHNSRHTGVNARIPFSLLERLDEAGDRFEDAWAAGRRPAIEPYLAEVPEPERPLLLGELLRLELEYRRRDGETPRPAEYLGRFSDHSAVVQDAFADTPEPAPHGEGTDAHSRATPPDQGRASGVEPPPDAGSRATPEQVTEPGTAAPAARRPAIAGYEILGELGKGGMGVVYQARDLRLRRLVALKMIRAGAYATPAELARFRAEAEVQASLQHPNIVQIFEVGAAEECPYITQEYVDGGGLDKQIAGTPRPAHAAAQLVETLARAIHSAHQRGLVHRDLKPSNVLLTAGGTPKITDFGLAKRLQGPAGQTKTGDVVGTPAYMAPEQAAGQSQVVGPATDIYALGTMLYELLTGRPPFLAATPLETLLQVRTQDPVPVRRLQPKVPRDLETVCLKCLHKEPAKRYPTAEALADDLRRFLEGKPIVARPVRVWERAFKWAKRRPALVAVGSLALILVVAAWAVGTVRTVREKARAEEALRLALQEGTRADETLSLALQVMDEIALKALEKQLPAVGGFNILKERFEGLPPMHRELLQREPSQHVQSPPPRADNEEALPPGHRELLQQVLKLYEAFTRVNQNSPTAQREQGRAYRRIADVHYLLGQRSAADAAYRQAITYLEERAAALPDEPAFRQELALCYQHLALLVAASAPTLAEEPYRKAAALQERLAAEFPTVPDYRAELARTYSNLGSWLPPEQAAEGDQVSRRAVELLEQVVAEVPDQPEYRYFLAVAYLHQGGKLSTLNDKADTYRRALAICRPLVDTYPDRSDYAEALGTCYFSLGSILNGLGQPAEAEQAHHQSRQVFERLALAYPRVPGYQRQLAASFTNLGLLLHETDRLCEAEAAYRRALEHWDKVQRLMTDFATSVGHHYDLGVVLNNLGDLLQKRGDAQAARPLLEQSVDHHRSAFRANPQHSAVRGALSHRLRLLAEVLVQLGDYPAADAALEELFQILPDDWDDPFGAAASLARCAAHVERAPGLADSRRRALVAAYAGRIPDLVTEAVRRSADNPAVQNAIAWLLATSPEPWLRDGCRAAELAGRVVDRAPQEGTYWNTLGVAQYRVGNWPAAIEALNKSRHLRAGGDSFDFFFLAMAHWRLKEKSQAEHWWEQAVRWMEKNQPTDADLRRFRAEAAATLLGLPLQPPPVGPAAAPQS